MVQKANKYLHCHSIQRVLAEIYPYIKHKKMYLECRRNVRKVQRDGHLSQNFQSVQKTSFHLVYGENSSFNYKLSERKLFRHLQNFDQNAYIIPLDKNLRWQPPEQKMYKYLFLKISLKSQFIELVIFLRNERKTRKKN